MSDLQLADNEYVWQPTPEYVERSHLKRFMALHKVSSWEELWQQSVSDVAWFTDAVIRYLDIQFQEPYEQVVDLSAGIQWPHWCVGGKLNISFNCVDKWASRSDAENRTAI